MAAYDYRCRVCDRAFEVRRPVDAPADVVAAVSCPAGHAEVSRVFSAVALAGARGTAAPAPPAAGGCCGGGCCG